VPTEVHVFVTGGGGGAGSGALEPESPTGVAGSEMLAPTSTWEPEFETSQYVQVLDP